MGLLYKIPLAAASLPFVLVIAICGWLLLYTRDLPDFDHLSQFAPTAQSAASDACLPGASLSIPFELMGKPFQDALSAAEPTRLQADQIARSLMCHYSAGMGKYHLNTFRLSWQIRRRFSHREIFTIYANRAYFGVGLVGVEKASQEFFQKEPQALNMEEAALLAGLLRGPDYLSPYKNPERALHRRNEVLNEMVAQGKLSEKDAARLAAIPIMTRISAPTGPESVVRGLYQQVIARKPLGIAFSTASMLNWSESGSNCVYGAAACAANRFLASWFPTLGASGMTASCLSSCAICPSESESARAMAGTPNNPKQPSWTAHWLRKVVGNCLQGWLAELCAQALARSAGTPQRRARWESSRATRWWGKRSKKANGTRKQEAGRCVA
jgi:hypothetical protein